MRFRTQSLFPVGILTLLAALTFWLDRVTQVDAARDDSKRRHDPDYIAEAFTVKAFGAEGHLESTLTAARMVHYPDDDTTLMSTPRLSSHRGTRATHVTAEQALVGPDGREMTLVGNVRAVRDATRSDPEVVLTTQTLTLFPDDEIMRTPAPVTVTQGASVLRGTGLDADNRSGTLQLLGSVSGTIERKRR